MTVYSKRFFAGAWGGGAGKVAAVTCPAGRTYVIREIAAFAFGEAIVTPLLDPAGPGPEITVGAWTISTGASSPQQVRLVLHPGDVLHLNTTNIQVTGAVSGYDLEGP